MRFYRKLLTGWQMAHLIDGSAPRILILRGGAIGDFVLTLPAIQALRRRWPQAYIELVGYPHIAQLAHAGGLVDRITSLDKADVARYFSLRPCIPDEQSAYIQSFDLIVSYLYDPDEVVKRNLLAAGATQVLYGSPIVREAHAVDHLLKPLEELAIYAEELERPQLNLKENHLRNGRDRIKSMGERVVAIHPGSGSPTKNWPIDKFLDLVERITGNGSMTPVFIMGEADTDVAHELSRKKCQVPVLPSGSLVELAEWLSACAAYVGNDSGVTHIAASLGISVIALYGPTNPDLWGPRGPNVRILQETSETLAGIPVENVFKSLLLSDHSRGGS